MSQSDSDQNGDSYRIPRAAPSGGHREHANAAAAAGSRPAAAHSPERVATAAGEVRTPRTAVDILLILQQLQEPQFQQQQLMQQQQLKQQQMLTALMQQLAPGVSPTP